MGLDRNRLQERFVDGFLVGFACAVLLWALIRWLS